VGIIQRPLANCNNNKNDDYDKNEILEGFADVSCVRKRPSLSGVLV